MQKADKKKPEMWNLPGWEEAVQISKKGVENLIIANKELMSQNKEKEKRAAELVIANSELIKANSELDRFVYSASHDLRSPLTSVLGLVGFIEEETKEPDTLEYAEMIRTRIKSLDTFILNILSYSRNNHTGLEVQEIPLPKTVEEIVDSLSSMDDAKGIDFEVKIRHEQAFYSDSFRFSMVLKNLVSNAIKYHKKGVPGRYIRVNGRADDKNLHLCVEDNGCGIAPINHSKIFDMFFRVSGKTDGTGIGLYIVKETIQKLQGSIEVDSEEGRGTSFNLTLKNLTDDRMASARI